MFLSANQFFKNAEFRGNAEELHACIGDIFTYSILFLNLDLALLGCTSNMSVYHVLLLPLGHLKLLLQILQLTPIRFLINGCVRLASLGLPRGAYSGEPLTRVKRTITHWSRSDVMHLGPAPK